MNSLITIENNIPLADSRQIAETLGIGHNDFFNNIIKKYQTEIEEDFGVLRFQNGKPPKGSEGGRPETYVLLTEPQTYTVLTYSRNTTQARACKRMLVKAFIEANNQIAQLSTQQPVQEADIMTVIADVNKLDQCINHLQALKHLLYPEHIQEQLPLATQTQRDIMRVFKRVQKPLTVAQLLSRYFKSRDAALIHQECEALVASGYLSKEVTAHAVNGRYSLS